MGDLAQTTVPVLAYDSDNGSSEITLDLTSLGVPAAANCQIYELSRGGKPIWKASRTATGTFTLTGLTRGYHVFVAIPHNNAGDAGNASNLVGVSLGSSTGIEDAADHLQGLLAAAVWSSNKVFGFTKVTNMAAREIAKASILPTALVRIGNSQKNPVFRNYPKFRTSELRVEVIFRNKGDWTGEGVVKGKHAQSDSSSGKGWQDLYKKIMETVANQGTGQGTRYAYFDESDPELIDLMDDQAYSFSIVFKLETYNG